MAVTWPDSLPAPLKGVKVTQGANVVRMKTQSGRDRVYRFGAGAPDRVAVQFRMLHEFVPLFRTFYQLTCNGGVNYFAAAWLDDLNLPYADPVACFGTYPKLAGYGRIYSDFTCTLLVRPLADAPADTFWPRVGPAPQPPKANPDTATVAENATVSGNVLANDTDDSLSLTVSMVNGSAANMGVAVAGSNGGIFTIRPDGSWTFDPNGEFNALASGQSATTQVAYTAFDGIYEDSTTLTVTVTGLSVAPTAGADTGSTTKIAATSGNVLTNDTANSGGALTVAQVNGSAANVGTAVAGSNGGVFVINANGAWTFSPGNSFMGLGEGQSATTSVTYGVAEYGVVATTTLTVTVHGVTVPTVVTADTGAVNANGEAQGNVLTNDSTGYGALTVVAVNGSASNVGVPVAGSNGGLFTVSANGIWYFTPHGEFDGLFLGQTATTQVTYTASNGDTQATTTLTVTVTGVKENDPPVTSPDVVTTTKRLPVTGNVLDNDEDVEELTVSMVNGSAANVGVAVAGTNGGTFTIEADGTFTFSPNGEFNALLDGQSATTSVTYHANDGMYDTLGTLTVTVQGVTIVPTLTADTGATDAETTTSGNVLTNDDAGYGTLTVVAVAGESSNVGVAVAGSNGGMFTIYAGGAWSFDPAGDFGTLYEGQFTATTVTYTAANADAQSQAVLTVTVEGVLTNEAPVAVDDTATTTELATASGNVLTNDSDEDEDTLTVSRVNGSADNIGGEVAGSGGGVFTIAANGDWTFDPNGEFKALLYGQSATTSVTYHVTDGIVESTATLTVTVTGTQDVTPPTVADDTGACLNTGTASGNVLANDTDAEGVLTVSQVNGSATNVGVAVAGSSGGVFVVNADGDWAFDPSDDFDTLATGATATTSVTYHASDGVNESEGTLTVTVEGVEFGFSGVPVKQANPATLPTGTSYSCAFSPDGKYLAVAHGSSPFVTIYSVSEAGVFTKIDNPATLPTGTGRCCAFSPHDGGVRLAVGHNSSPFVTIYK
ncbi:MAG: VCBS domain-containing protein [Desulfovibrio sp.]|nr:VCBS domain-containing protein [Desulfovibrio sp.]